MKILSFIAVVFLMMGCTSSKDVAQPDVKTDMKQIQLESNGCYGTCPQFTIIVMQDGTARYDARRFNPQQGQYTTTLKKPQLDSLLQLVNNTNYFTLQDNYPAMVSDVVAYKSTLTLQDGKTKTISDQGPNGPANLKALYTFMLSLRTSQNWR